MYVFISPYTVPLEIGIDVVKMDIQIKTGVILEPSIHLIARRPMIDLMLFVVLYWCKASCFHFHFDRVGG